MSHLQITVQHPDFDTVHVTVSGALDLARAYDFDDKLRRIERAAPGRILIEFLDTAGLGRLLAVRRRCRRAGRRLVVVRGSRAVQRLFSQMSLTEQFEVVGDPAELVTAA